MSTPTIPTFNKFKSTTIYGAFNNLDYEDNTVQASSNIQRNLTVGGDLSCNGIMSGGSASFNMLNLDQPSSTSPAIIQFRDNSGNTKALFYTSAISNVFRFSVYSSNGFEWENAGTNLMQLNTSGHLTVSGATFSGNVSGLTAINSDNSTKFATTAFVKNQNYITSNPDLSPYALLTGAAFTGSVTGVTAQSSDSSQKFATTSFVKGQNYATVSQLNNVILTIPSIYNPTFQNTLTINYIDPNAFTNYYPLTISNTSGTLSLNTSTGSYPIKLNASNLQLSTNNGTNYYDVLTTNTGALLSGATFTGNVSGITATTTDNSTLLATTAFVKAQNYLTTASLSSSYALLSGATFTGNVFGLTATTADNTTKFATTAFVKAQNYITSASLPSLTPYALLAGATFTGNVSGLTATTADNSTQFATTAWVKLQNYLTSASLSAYALLSGAIFTGGVEIKNTLNLTQPTSTSSTVLQFSTNTGLPRATIYSSFVSSRFCFDISPFYNEYGFEWRVSGEPIMRLGLGGTIITNGSISTPYTKIGSQEIISQASITLSFPLLSSYLIQTTQPASVYLPVITANWEMGVEVLFIKNSGTCTIYAANNNVIIDSLLFQSTSINISQYRRLISTKLSSGIFGWMVVGSGN